MAELSALIADAAHYEPEHHSHLARNYCPIPLDIIGSEGIYTWDADGTVYIDALSCYGAVNFGHLNERAVQALHDQTTTPHAIKGLFRSGAVKPGDQIEALKRVTSGDAVSRNWTSRVLEEAANSLCEFTRMDRILPMNGGAEAVETAVKAMRRWAYDVKKIQGDAQIITFKNCFHGRTPSAIAASSDEQHVRRGFGPFLPGFIRGVEYGNAAALESVLKQHAATVAGVLIEPIQGEAGVIIPPAGYMREVQKLCKQYNVLLVADEIQSGYARSGLDFATDELDERPDGLIIAKAMGAGLIPVSAFLAKKEVMDVFDPGSHGSTFSGNPLAAAVSLEVTKIMSEECMAERSAEIGMKMKRALQALDAGFVTDVRGQGLWIGIELASEQLAHEFCVRMVLDQKILCKDAHSTVRISPPFTASEEQMRYIIKAVIDTTKAMQAEIGPRVVPLHQPHIE